MAAPPAGRKVNVPGRRPVPATGCSTPLEHPLQGTQSCLLDLPGEHQLRLPIAHTEVELLQGVELHMWTLVAGTPVVGRGGDKGLLGSPFLHLMQDAGLGDDDELLLGAAEDAFEDSLGAADVVRV